MISRLDSSKRPPVREILRHRADAVAVGVSRVRDRGTKLEGRLPLAEAVLYADGDLVLVERLVGPRRRRDAAGPVPRFVGIDLPELAVEDEVADILRDRGLELRDDGVVRGKRAGMTLLGCVGL